MHSQPGFTGWKFTMESHFFDSALAKGNEWPTFVAWRETIYLLILSCMNKGKGKEGGRAKRKKEAMQ